MSQAARASASRKPDAEALKAMMKGAFSTPDATPSGPSLSVVPHEPASDPRPASQPAGVNAAVDQETRSGPHPAEPVAPVANAPAIPSSEAELQTDPQAGVPAEPVSPATTAPAAVPPAAQQPTEALRPAAEAPLEHPQSPGDPTGEGRARSETQAENDRPRVGRKRHPKPLRNITLSLPHEVCDRIMELTAYERLRLGRAVDMSEIVRQFCDDGLASVVDNRVLPEAGARRSVR